MNTDVPMLVARMACLIYLSAGVATLSGEMDFKKLIKEYEKSRALSFLTGFLALICGVLLLNAHNEWEKNWTSLITLIGWMSLAKGIMLMAFPQTIQHFKGWYKNQEWWGVFLVALGLFFGYFGFVM